MSHLKRGITVSVSKPKNPKMFSIRRCEVRLRNLKISKKQKMEKLIISKKQQRMEKLKRCRVDLNNSDYKNYIQQYQAKQVSSLLERLENESDMRATMLKQRTGKVNKTRNSLAYVNTKVTHQPQTPQAEFLGQFNLKPCDRISNSVIMKPDRMLPSNRVVQHSKDSDVDSGVEDTRSEYSAPELTTKLPNHHRHQQHQEQQQDVNADIMDFSIDLVRLDLKSVCGSSTVGLGEMFDCPLCPRTFVKYGHLKKHIQRLHRMSDDPPDSRSVLDLSTAPSEHSCQACDIPFSTAASLRKHEAIHHPRLSRPGFVSPSKAERRCGDCSKQFQSQASLKRHILTEHRGFKSPCPRCGLSVARLDNHLATVHGGALSPCPLCRVRLLPAHLPRHINAVHLGLRTRCVLCDKFISNLHKHQRSLHGVTHTDHSDCSCVLYSGPHWGISK